MKALFLDRDGIINERIVGGYVSSPDEFILIDDILPVLKHAKKMGYRLIVISNQQGVGKGLMSQAQLNSVDDYMQGLLINKVGFSIDERYYATDVEGSGSIRRKPAPGMLMEAIENNRLMVDKCWFIGDSVTDALAGRAASVNTILIGQYPPTLATLVFSSIRHLHQHLFKILVKT